MSGDGVNFSEKLARDVKTATGLVLGNRGNETVQAFGRTNVRQTRFYKAPGGGIAAPSNSTTPSSATCTLMKWNAAGTALEVTNTTETVYSFSAYAADSIFQAKQVGGKIFADASGPSEAIAIPSIYPVTTTTDSDLEFTRLPLRMQYTKVDGSHNPSAVTSSSVSEYYANNLDDFGVSINGTAARFIILQPGTYRGIITFYQQFIRAGTVSHQVPVATSITQVTDQNSNTVNVAGVTGLKNVWFFPQLEIEHRLMITGLGNSIYRDGQFSIVSINKKIFPYTTVTDSGEIHESYEISMPFCFSVAADSFSNDVFSPFEFQLWLKRPGLFNGALIRTFSNVFHSGTSWMVRSDELLEHLPSVISTGGGGVQPFG